MAVDELAPFVLRNVKGLGTSDKTGAGSYGSVYEVTVDGVRCIAKRLHDVFMSQSVSVRERESIQRKFRQECLLLSKLKHPNIVRFMGVHYGRDSTDLSLIMERLHTDLSKYLESHPDIPLPVKLSILLEVSFGLLYLHTHNPPIIHRDLSAKNILLTDDLHAKIADLGVSKLFDIRKQAAATQTKVPGTHFYMPPEALRERPIYNAKLDVFSFGHLSLYAAIQEFPEVYEVTLTPTMLKEGLIQVAKRKSAIEKMGSGHCLYPLVLQCLSDDPAKRPTTADLRDTLKGLCQKHPRSLARITGGKEASIPASLLKPQPTFKWKRDANMPVGVHGAHGLLTEDKLYLGGGDTCESTTDNVVYEYDINGLVRKWTPLPPAPVTFFAMAEVNKNLTLIGGWNVAKKSATNQLTVWSREEQRWTNPFPPMPTPRQDSTAVTYQLWLLVAGGMNFKKPVHNVELFDYSTLHWQTIQSLPRPSVGMTSCIVNKIWYLLGSEFESGPQKRVYALPLVENIGSSRWDVLPDCPLYCSTAVPFGDHLMSVGGTNSLTSCNHSTAMFLFSPATKTWHFAGDMPTHRCRATCIMLSKGRLIVLGGQERGGNYGATVELLYY